LELDLGEKNGGVGLRDWKYAVFIGVIVELGDWSTALLSWWCVGSGGKLLPIGGAL